MKTPMRLVWGASGLGVLVLACGLGPFLLTDTGDGDPLHASLLPPLSRVTILELNDGRTLISPEVMIENGLYRVRGPRTISSIPPDDVAARTGARLWLGSDCLSAVGSPSLSPPSVSLSRSRSGSSSGSPPRPAAGLQTQF